MAIHVKTNELPTVVKKALSALQYGSPTIGIESAEKVAPVMDGGTGQRGFLALINLNQETFEIIRGSWGGANIFNQRNAVDLDQREYPLPPHGAALKGHTGYPKTFATLYIHPSQMTGHLPLPAPELTEDERFLLELRCSCTSAGVKSELERAYWKARRIESTTTSLVTKGFLARNKAGAVSVTLAGKNARGR